MRYYNSVSYTHLAKGRKTFRICETITPDNPPYSVLGCWVINHEFEATQNEKQMCIRDRVSMD